MAKRLESLGALTHGDRRATESRDLSKYNVDTKYGRQALETTIKSIVGTGPQIVTTEEYSEEFFERMSVCVCVGGGGVCGGVAVLYFYNYHVVKITRV